MWGSNDTTCERYFQTKRPGNPGWPDPRATKGGHAMPYDIENVNVGAVKRKFLHILTQPHLEPKDVKVTSPCKLWSGIVGRFLLESW